MTLDRLTQITSSGISSDSTITVSSIAGIITATSATISGNLTGNTANFSGNITGTTASFSGNVSVAGTLTYEDVTNVDSIGVITARSGVIGNLTGNVTGNITGNVNSSGISTFTQTNINSQLNVGIGGTVITTTVGGNVGLGTNSPTEKLHVIGDILSSGSIDAGTQFLGQANDTYLYPSYSWTGDTDTGFYRPAENEIAVVTAGSTSARFTGNDFEVYQDVFAGRVNGSYSSGENGNVISYARNPSTHPNVGDWTAYVQMLSRYTIDDVAVFQHIDRDASNNETVRSAIKSTGRATFHDNVYAGFTQTSTTGTPVANANSGIFSVNAYGRFATDQPNSTGFSAITGIVGDYRGPGTSATSEPTAVIYHRQRSASNVDLWIHNLTAEGTSWHYGSVFAGRSASSTTGTPSYYYNPSENAVYAYGSNANCVTYIAGRTGADTAPVIAAEVDNVLQFEVEADSSVHSRLNSYGSTSDERLKQDITDAESSWDDVKSYRVRKFRYISDVQENPDAPELLGVIAQEIETISPGLVGEQLVYETDSETDEKVWNGETVKTVKYSVLYMKAVKALQEAMNRIEQLESSNTDLIARITALESQINN